MLEVIQRKAEKVERTHNRVRIKKKMDRENRLM
jgi:hypothetical protein